MIAFIPYTQGMFELWIVPAVGGEQRKIMNIWSNFFAWSPDSKEIALFDYDGRFVIVSIHNGIARNVFDYEEYGLDDIGYFCWSPDGQYMAFAGYKDEEPPQIYTIALQSGLVKQVTNDKVYDNKRVLSNLYWSPDGKWITYGLDGFVKTRPSVLSGKLKWRSFCMNQRKVKTRFDYSLLFTGLCLASLALSIIVFSLTGVVAQAPQKAQIAFSSDRDGNAEIYIMDADGNNQRRITNDPKGDDWPAWSPDGKIIAFTSDRDGLYEIYAIDADGNNQQNLTNNPADDMSPTWSPDGKLIAFESIRDGNPEIYVMDADGNNQRNLTNNPAIDSAPAWSPDGKVIAFCSMRDGNFEIYVMDANGNNQRRLTNNPAIDYGLAWSPDNQRIAFKSVRDGNQEIYAMDANGNNQRNLTNNPEIDSYPAWSPVGKTIAFASYRDGNQEIYVMDADGNNQRNLTNNPAEDSSPGWFDPDFTYKAISPIDRLMSRWGWIKQGSEY